MSAVGAAIKQLNEAARPYEIRVDAEETFTSFEIPFLEGAVEPEVMPGAEGGAQLGEGESLPVPAASESDVNVTESGKDRRKREEEEEEEEEEESATE